MSKEDAEAIKKAVIERWEKERHRRWEKIEYQCSKCGWGGYLRPTEPPVYCPAIACGNALKEAGRTLGTKPDAGTALKEQTDR